MNMRSPIIRSLNHPQDGIGFNGVRNSVELSFKSYESSTVRSDDLPRRLSHFELDKLQLYGSSKISIRRKHRVDSRYSSYTEVPLEIPR
jgi:hypothetical protein